MKVRFNAPARIAMLTVFSIAFLFVFVFPTRSYLSQSQQVGKARHDLSVLRHQNAALDKEAKRLQTSAEIIRIAREQDKMALPGEKMYSIIPTPPPAVTTTTVAPPTTTTSTTVTSTSRTSTP
jgi:cell division protein FtsB